MKKRSKIWPTNDPALDAETEILFDHLGRHVVSLNIEFLRIDEKGKKSDEEFIKIFSCFVIAFGDHWFLATAGHILEEIDKALTEKKIEILDCTIADYFGKDAEFQFTTPFPFESSEKSFIYEPSLVADFALIYLRPLYRKGLEANKVVPLLPSQCVPLDRFNFAKFIIFGFPDAVVAPFNTPVKHGERSNYKLAPVLISAQRIDFSQVPDDIRLPRCNHPYFLGKLEPAQYPSMEGMSGGPIFGLIHEPGKNTQYSLVAIQSAWYSKYGIVLGTPAVVFAAIASEAMHCAPSAGPVA
jgi:hypothetical protein